MFSRAGKVLPIGYGTGKGTALIHGTSNFRATRLKSRVMPGSTSAAGTVGLKVYLSGLVRASFARTAQYNIFCLYVDGCAYGVFPYPGFGSLKPKRSVGLLRRSSRGTWELLPAADPHRQAGQCLEFQVPPYRTGDRSSQEVFARELSLCRDVWNR